MEIHSGLKKKCLVDQRNVQSVARQSILPKKWTELKEIGGTNCVLNVLTNAVVLLLNQEVFKTTMANYIASDVTRQTFLTKDMDMVAQEERWLLLEINRLEVAKVIFPKHRFSFS